MRRLHLKSGLHDPRPGSGYWLSEILSGPMEIACLRTGFLSGMRSGGRSLLDRSAWINVVPGKPIRCVHNGALDSGANLAQGDTGRISFGWTPEMHSISCQAQAYPSESLMAKKLLSSGSDHLQISHTHGRPLQGETRCRLLAAEPQCLVRSG